MEMLLTCGKREKQHWPKYLILWTLSGKVGSGKTIRNGCKGFVKFCKELMWLELS
jgi:hypothetical protein